MMQWVFYRGVWLNGVLDYQNGVWRVCWLVIMMIVVARNAQFEVKVFSDNDS